MLSQIGNWIQMFLCLDVSPQGPAMCTFVFSRTIHLSLGFARVGGLRGRDQAQELLIEQKHLFCQLLDISFHQQKEIRVLAGSILRNPRDLGLNLPFQAV